jgi:hypothetical protein
VAGAIAWAGVAWIGWTLWQSQPPRAGFDLALLLEAARRVLAGESPYDPAMLAGTSPGAVDLFYSYPPPVAQTMTALAWLPDGVVLVLWALGATAGLAVVAALVARGAGRDPWRMALRAGAVAPLVLPFAIAILFGNLDAWYPLAYGAVLLAAMPGASNRTRLAGGAALAAVAIAKLHPAPLLLWVAARAVAQRGGSQARVLAAAAVTGVAILAVSLAVGGFQPWLDYGRVAGVAAGAELVDPRNVGPASLAGLATGLSGPGLRWLQVVVVLGVVAVTLLAAVRVRDPLTSVALATAASLVTLPVTWYHYPVALLPVAVALAIRHPAARPRLVLAAIVVDLAIAWPALLWLAVAIVLVAAVESARRAPRAPTPAARVPA